MVSAACGTIVGCSTGTPTGGGNAVDDGGGGGPVIDSRGGHGDGNGGHGDGGHRVDAAVATNADARAHNTIDSGVASVDGNSTPTQSGTGPFFSQQEFFNEVVTGVAPASNSSSLIASLNSAGGWGNGNVMQIDFTIDVLTANASTPMMTFTPNSDFYSPDCDHVAIPVPVGGDIEGNTGYACNDDGDCHLLVYAPATQELYEMYRADLEGSTLSGGCLAVWDTNKAYGPSLRGDQCTSADAAGFPISPLLFTADEVAAGHIDHAIRFILPNTRMQGNFVRPATHGTFAASGNSSAPNYGVHLRLRADYPLASLPNDGARTVAKAMQTYGMYLADGGNIALTARSDNFTTAKWSGLLAARDLSALKVSDFDVIDHGPPITLTQDCVRN